MDSSQFPGLSNTIGVASSQAEVETANNESKTSVSVHDNSQFCDDDFADPNSFPTCPPEESVFDIEHILEEIFSLLDRKSLLNCRLVSLRWGFLGSKQLQKIVSLEFTNSDYQPATKKSHFALSDNPLCLLDDLSALMTTSSSFPCNSFVFNGSKGFPPSHLGFPQSFLKTHGAELKKFKWVGSSYFEDIRKLLLVYSLNLEELVIQGIVRFEKSRWRNEEDDDNFPLSTTGGQFLFPNAAEANFKLKLKFLELRAMQTVFPQDIFREILQVSPYLSRVRLPPLLTMSYAHLLVQPPCHPENLNVNYLYLLKTLEIYPSTENIDSLEILATPKNSSWALEEIEARVEVNSPSQHLWSRAAHVISKIMSGSLNSCSKLVWHQMGFLQGLYIPQMGKVKQIQFQYNMPPRPEFSTLFFPPGISLAEKFPGLRSVFVLGGNSNVSISYLFDADQIKPVATVRSVYLDSKLYDNEILRDSFQKMFPNAEVTFYVDTSE